MAISPDDYVSRDLHVIFPADINERIDELKKTIREAQQDGGEPFDEDVEEADALIDFRDRVQAQTGNHFDEATIVPEDEFEDHAQDWARGIGDFEFLDTYVEWERFAGDLKGERFTAIDFGDDTVYVR